MGAQAIYESLRGKLSGVLPDFELRLKAEVAEEVLALKAERGAIILAHNYMEPALYHSVPDFRGDSLELSRKAASLDAPVVVFCGVRFMAETAKVLSPKSRVLLPSAVGGCSLASAISPEDVRRLRARFPGVPIVAYVNTTAAVKAEVDVCCTSSNAAAIVESQGAETVLLIPDEFLGRNVANETGRRFFLPDEASGEAWERAAGAGRVVGWAGCCEVHEKFTVEDVTNVRRQFPDVAVLAHPECRPEVVAVSDFCGSTSAMQRYLETSAPASRFLLLTECAMADNVAAAAPGREMLRLCSVRCPHMNEIRLEDVRDALRYDRYEVDVPEPVRSRAERALRRMLER